MFFFLSPFTFHLSPLNAQTIGLKEMGDSLTAYTGFSRVWAAPVRVTNLRTNGNAVTIRTNGTLRDFRWTPDNVATLKRKVSLWTFGHENGKVTILSNGTDIETLITDCARQTSNAQRQTTNYQRPTTNDHPDLTDRTIVVYPSHGMFFNRTRDEWIWQRATLWTTVEDLFSQEYVRLIRQMIENAGGTVLMPRAGLDQQQTGESGMPLWAEGARYWLMHQKEDSTLWDLYDGNEYKDDMKCRGMWINAQKTPIDLCVAFHTDGNDSGNDSTVIGTLVIYTEHDDDGHKQLRDGRNREKTNRNLGDWIQTQITEDLRHIDPRWTRRQLREANYCETRIPVVPSIILELLSHKNMADMRYGLDPDFRFAASRAIYKGILRYLNGLDAIVQPLPVQQLCISTGGLLQWEAPLDSIEPSAAPSYYMVYIRTEDGEWDVQQVEKATQLQLDLQRGVRYSFYVVAGNEGGLSFPSPVISAYLSNSPKDGLTAQRSNSAAVLIVDAFSDSYGPEWFADSTYAGIVPGSYACENGFSCAYIGAQWNYTRSDAWHNDDNCGWGSCYRDHAGQITVGNTHDWSVRHGEVLQQMGISYVSSTAGMCAALPDSAFRLIDYVAGRQRRPLTEQTYRLLAKHLDQGGQLLLSTDHFSAIDPAWAKRYLHASFYAPHATHSGKVKATRLSRFSLRLYMEPNEEQLFTCTPEGLKPDKAAIKMAIYEDMHCPAAVGYRSPTTNDQRPITLVFGFPLEAVHHFDKIYRHAIEWLVYEKEKPSDF